MHPNAGQVRDRCSREADSRPARDQLPLMLPIGSAGTVERPNFLTHASVIVAWPWLTRSNGGELVVEATANGYGRAATSADHVTASRRSMIPRRVGASDSKLTPGSEPPSGFNGRGMGCFRRSANCARD